VREKSSPNLCFGLFYLQKEIYFDIILNMKKIIGTNRRAFHDYEILETYESGIVLLGPEVKSLREGRVALRDGFGRIEGEEAFLYDVHISPYEKSSAKNYEPKRKRKLLLHKQEIKRLMGKVLQRGLTLIPLEMYFKDGNAKVSLGLARGKRIYDKREALKKRELEREIRRSMKDRDRGGD